MEAGRVLAEVQTGPTAEQADEAIRIIDAIIGDVYLPSRGSKGFGTERAILPGPRHAPHRENIAEHSFHLALTAKVLWDNRERLGLDFPEDFDINKAVLKAIVHDVPEVWAGDVDAMTRDQKAIRLKRANDMAAIVLMRRKYPFLAGVAEECEAYEHKESPEDDYINDLDKIIATRVICVDGGRRWFNWHGTQTERDFMVERMRGKLRTTNGHAIFDALERDLDSCPELFPDYAQDRLF